MNAITIVAILAGIAVLVWGILGLKKHIFDKYKYNVLNIGIIVMMVLAQVAFIVYGVMVFSSTHELRSVLQFHALNMNQVVMLSGAGLFFLIAFIINAVKMNIWWSLLFSVIQFLIAFFLLLIVILFLGRLRPKIGA